mmetsp:Transcript_38377/g.90163  ORF Transcript_38377/g.90163 Transcript_38377/m.90163 type:complete len:396 (+) Transcript_38377:38-1225(+)
MSISLARRIARPGARALAPASRAFSASPSFTVEFDTPFKAYMCDGPGMSSVEATKEEVMELWSTMYKMRRMELAADQLYKAKQIRGFCHLYDGQEAVCVGMEAAISMKDSIITAYRDHCYQLSRGDSPASIYAELMGRASGCARGKGGSMHMYMAKNNFFGGNGIVGAQQPLGAGLAFAHKYKGDGGVALALYGDGAANQGQLFEAMNMAALWKLPIVFVCENNQYGMGTAKARSSANTDYFTRGVYIPGIKVDGMSVLAVRTAVAHAAAHCREGKGPFVLEMDTYRYHGHSMSDPGVTYRNRDEVSGVRRARDPVEGLKKIMLEHSLATPEELKALETKIRKEIDVAVEFAKKESSPAAAELYRDIYRSQDPHMFIRGPDLAASHGDQKWQPAS